VINQDIHTPHTDPDPTDQMHALTIKDPNNPLQPVILPLILRGVTSLLYVRPVTIDEFNSLDHPRLHLTSKTLTWDPLTTLFEEQETAMTDYSGNIISNAAVRGPSEMLSINELHSLTTNMADITHVKRDDNLSDFLTKTTSGAKHRKLVSGVVHDIYDDFSKQ
jgi:hypothetical protein